METTRGEITELLVRWKEGEPQALEELMPLVYPHLRVVAAAYIRRERKPGVMQATSLVHELYLRLLSQKKAALEDRVHFYTFCARAMRMILIDHARETLSQRRGGMLQHIPLDDEMPWVEIGSPEILQLSIALDELYALDPNKVELVELRYFLGCTSEETAELAKVSKATVDRELKFVRTWLYGRLYPERKSRAPVPDRSTK
jgi:RNA polymerase sigma factor (TIGR02999 family)